MINEHSNEKSKSKIMFLQFLIFPLISMNTVRSLTSVLSPVAVIVIPDPREFKSNRFQRGSDNVRLAWPWSPQARLCGS